MQARRAEQSGSDSWALPRFVVAGYASLAVNGVQQAVEAPLPISLKHWQPVGVALGKLGDVLGDALLLTRGIIPNFAKKGSDLTDHPALNGE